MLTKMITNKISSANESTMSEVMDIQNVQVSNQEAVAPVCSTLLPLPTAEDLEKQKEQEEVAVLVEYRVLPETEVPEEEYCFEVKGKGIFPKGDINAIQGKAKAGKTTALLVFLIALLCGQSLQVKSLIKGARVLWLDTEQKLKDVKKIIERALKISGVSNDYIRSHLWLFHFRARSYETLGVDTERLIRHVRPDIVFIDGLVDYVKSFNDEVESKEIIDLLVKMSETYQCTIINVLHENKAISDENMRGHLGSRLMQKGNDILQCKVDKKGIISVSSFLSRHEKMEEFYVGHDKEGNLINVDAKVQEERQRKEIEAKKRKQEQKEAGIQRKLNEVVEVINANGGSILKNDLNEQLQIRWKIDRTGVSRFLNARIKDNKLFEANKIITATPQTTLTF